MKDNIYATLEIKEDYLIFLIVHYIDNCLNVIYRQIKSDTFTKNGIILNTHKVIKLISRFQDDAKSKLHMEVKDLKVGIIMPSNNLSIQQTLNSKQFPKNYKINFKDIKELRKTAKESFLLPNEKILFLKEYEFVINNDKNTVQYKPPIGKTATHLLVRYLIYIIDIEIYNSYKKVLDATNIKVRNFFPRGYAIGLRTIMNNPKSGSVVIDWNFESVTVNLFIKQVLCKIQSYDNLGINTLLNKLKSVTLENDNVIKTYLFKLLSFHNLDDIDEEKYINNNEFAKISFKKLKEECISYCKNVFFSLNNTIESLVEKDAFLKSNIIISGSILKISNFKEIIAKYSKYDLLLYNSSVIGLQNSWSIALLGNIYYQVIMDKNKNSEIM